MSLSPSVGRQGLKAFRLSDVPIEIRLRAALAVARAHREADDKVDPRDRLFARLRSDAAAGGDSTETETIKQIAQAPSERVYWISRDAWERVIG